MIKTETYTAVMDGGADVLSLLGSSIQELS
jgi:hypothetical protein